MIGTAPHQTISFLVILTMYVLISDARYTPHCNPPYKLDTATTKLLNKIHA